MARKKKKYYVVWRGREPGVYENWSDCEAQVSGFGDAEYLSFPSLEEAERAYLGTAAEAGFGSKSSKSSKTKAPKADLADFADEIEWDSIAVDAACSGNPGILEYQGVETASQTLLFHQGPFDEGTVNIGEFLAIVHGLAYLHKHGSSKTVYTDSRTAIAWVRKKKANTKLSQTVRSQPLFELIARAERWLKANSYSNPIVKWETKRWGEIPADFGRK